MVTWALFIEVSDSSGKRLGRSVITPLETEVVPRVGERISLPRTRYGEQYATLKLDNHLVVTDVEHLIGDALGTQQVNVIAEATTRTIYDHDRLEGLNNWTSAVD